MDIHNIKANKRVYEKDTGVYIDNNIIILLTLQVHYFNYIKIIDHK